MTQMQDVFRITNLSEINTSPELIYALTGKRFVFEKINLVKNWTILFMTELRTEDITDSILLFHLRKTKTL